LAGALLSSPTEQRGQHSTSFLREAIPVPPITFDQTAYQHYLRRGRGHSSVLPVRPGCEAKEEHPSRGWKLGRDVFRGWALGHTRLTIYRSAEPRDGLSPFGHNCQPTFGASGARGPARPPQPRSRQGHAASSGVFFCAIAAIMVRMKPSRGRFTGGGKLVAQSVAVRPHWSGTIWGLALPKPRPRLEGDLGPHNPLTTWSGAFSSSGISNAHVSSVEDTMG